MGATLSGLPSTQLGVNVVARKTQQARNLGQGARQRLTVALGAGWNFFACIALRRQQPASVQHRLGCGGRHRAGVRRVNL